MRPSKAPPRAPFAALAAAILLAVGFPVPAASAAPVRAERAVAVAADLAATEASTRLTIVLSRAVPATSFHLERPDRVVVDLPDVNCQIPAESGRRRAGLVASFRCGLFALGRSRLVVDLAQPALVRRLALEDGPSPGTTHLVVELARTEREAFRRGAGAASDSGPETTGAIAPAPAPDGRPLVAIDAGHGGQDPGAIAAGGHAEKDIVLLFAQALRDRLAASGRVRVMMIRDGDTFVALDERVRVARQASADLFVSIHGDYIGSAGIRGATIYTGAERATDAESAKLAERENAADLAGGIVPPEALAGISDILHELTLRETRGLSHRFAAMLHGELGPVMAFSAQPHREAGFRVLRAPDMTSVLVELGYLSNSRDANLLLSDDWRRRTAAAMAGAVERFFGARAAVRAAVSP